MKKILSLLLVIAMMVTLAVTVSAEETTAYDLYVGGVQVTSDNLNDVLGDGTVSFDPTTNTLTLNGANISTDENGIEADIDLTIVLNGTNTIKSDCQPIFGKKNVTVNGSGSLDAETAGYGPWDCIYSKGNLTVNGGELFNQFASGAG